MSAGKNALIVITILVILLLAGIVVIKNSQRFSSSSETTTPEERQLEATASGADLSASPSADTEQTVIKVTRSGFSPAKVTIKAGQAVTWMNTDSVAHQVNSNPHPIHTDYPPLNTIGKLSPGDQKSLMFPTPGIYKFHDHLFPQNQGSVTVE